MTKKMVRLRRQFQNPDAAYSSIPLGTTPIMKLEVAENTVLRDVPSICWSGFHDGPVLR
jgi:hypothetical protein